MEWILAVLIIGAVGGVLGYFAAKKWKPGKTRMIEGLLLSTVLCLSVYAALEVSKVYLACVVLAAGELIRITVPKKEK